MKKTILFLLVILACQVMYAGTIDVNINEEPEKIELEEDDITKGNEPQRSMKIIEAYLNRNGLSVDFYLYNIGTATIRIVNSYGDIVSSVSSDTTLPVTLSIPLPDVEDEYIIEIVSHKFHAYGYFSL